MSEPHTVPLIGKMLLQEKMADLESRIVALEKTCRRHTVTTTTTVKSIDRLEKEANAVWKAFNDLFVKVFKE